MNNDGTGLRERLKLAANTLDPPLSSEWRPFSDKANAALMREAAAALSAVAPPPVLEGWERKSMAFLAEGLRKRGDDLSTDVASWLEKLAASPAAPVQPEGAASVVARIHTTPDGRSGLEPAWIEVPALAVGQFFAVHADVTYYPQIDRTELADGGRFGVTHLPSGLNVASSPTMEGAVQAAKAMAEIAIDWANLSRDQVAALPADVITQVKVIRAAASVDGDIFTNAEMDEAAAIASNAAASAADAQEQPR